MSAHVVLVDEELAMQMVVTATLQSHGYRVTAVSPGSATPLPPDIDLFILSLAPHQINATLTTFLAQHVPIIALVPDHQSGSRALTAGADDYLCKPFNQSELLVRTRIQLRLKEVVEHGQHLQDKLDQIAREQVQAEQYRTRLSKTERQQRTLVETLGLIIQAINKSLRRDDVLEQILDQLSRVLPYDSASIMLLQGDNLQSVAQRSLHAGGRKGTRLPLEKFPHIQRVFSSRAPVIVGDTANDPRWQTLPKTSQICCWMGIPLIIQAEIVGLLNLSSGKPHQYGQAEADIAMIFTRQAAVAIEHARLQEQVLDEEQRVVEQTRALTEAYGRLQALGQFKSELMDSMTQEMLNPVTNLALYLDLWERANPEKQAQYLEVLRDQTQHLVKLAEGLVRLAQTDLMKSPLDISLVDLNSVVVAAVNMYRQRATALGLQLDITLVPDLPLVRGDWQQLVEMLGLLLDNAVSFTASGAIRVRTLLDVEQQQVGLTVQDTGAGIADEELPHVFDSFYSGSGAVHGGKLGIGLGLTLVQGIVHIHKGTVSARSDSGNGVFVQVWLPAEL